MNGKARLMYGVLGMALLMLSGCGDGNDPDPVNSGSETVIGVSYVVSTNNRLVVTSSEPAEIRVRHSVSPDQRTVMLVSGRAELLQ